MDALHPQGPEDGEQAAEPTVELLERFVSLYERGRYLSALELAGGTAGLAGWRRTAPRVWAGRLARHLGAGRRGDATILSAWRADREQPLARYDAAYVTFARRGPWAAWRRVQEPLPPETPADLQADWHALRGTIRGALRDFAGAEAELARAEELGGRTAWLTVERTRLLEREDRVEEALELAGAVLLVHPESRALVQVTAQLLHTLGRPEESLALLEPALEAFESSLVAGQLARLQEELGRYDAAWRSWDRFLELAPLLEAVERRAVQGARSTVAYLRGETALAIELAAQGGPFHAAVGASLEAHPEGRRVLLPVPFVRQDHMTCAPASLAMVAQGLGTPLTQEELSEEITYDGTPGHLERAWARERGWTTREFTVDEEAARALLDAGVPFTLVTAAAASAHMQVVVGYDARRGTLLIRDPSQAHQGEALVAPFLAGQAWSGPRGLVLLPPGQESKAAGLVLPEEAAYDALHALERALDEHRREDAEAAWRELQAGMPDARQALLARSLLAGYDGDLLRQLQATDALLERYPDTPHFLLVKLSCLERLGRRRERIELLEHYVQGGQRSEEEGVRPDAGRPGRPRPRWVDPVLWRSYALELLEDARQHPRVASLLRRALRWAPTEPLNLQALGDLLWAQRARDVALEAYRFAACLAETDDRTSQVYFDAARALGREEGALAFLRARLERYGGRSPRPACTLFNALMSCERTEEALAVLEQALARLPDDGELRVFAAESFARVGQPQRAAELLESARDRVRPRSWRRAAARLASARGAPAEALAHLEEVLRLEPLDTDLQAEAAALVAQLEGRPAARERLARAVAAQPRSLPLRRLHLGWLRDAGDPARAAAALEELLREHPGDPWARRERALQLAELGRIEEALAEAEAARPLDPHHPSSSLVLGRVLLVSGQPARALERWREAVRLDADAAAPVDLLADACQDEEQLRRELEFLAGELRRQAGTGPAILAYARQARRLPERAAALEFLEELRRDRPELWAAWSAVIQHRALAAQTAEARALAEEAAERFPLRRQAWLDLAWVARLGGDRQREAAALERVLALDPTDGDAIGRLAEYHRHAGQRAEAVAVLEQGLSRRPQDGALALDLARLRWHDGQREEALGLLERAVRSEPGLRDAWDDLRAAAAELAQPERWRGLLDEVVAARPGDAKALVLRAQLRDDRPLEERLTDLAAAQARDPADSEVADLRATLLVEAGRYDEAEAACAGEAGASTPIELRGRAAWVRRQRARQAGDSAGGRAARQAMEDVLAGSPGYLWGWGQLCAWCREDQDLEAALAAARGMVAAAPLDPWAARQLAEVLAARGDRAGLLEAQARWVDLAPGDLEAAGTLFELRLGARDAAGAAEVLERVQARAHPAWLAGARVRLAAVGGDLEGQRSAWAALLEEPTVGYSTVEDCWQTASERLRRELERWMRERVLSDRTGFGVGVFWAERLHEAGRRVPVGRLVRLKGDGAKGVLARHLELLSPQQSGLALRWLLFRHGERLGQDDRLWAAVGYALRRSGRPGFATRWLGDWRQRQGVRSWDLLALALSWRELGQPERAAEVHRAALELERDAGWAEHALWLALDAAHAGDPAEAARLRELAGEPAHVRDRLLGDLSQLVLEPASSWAALRPRMHAVTQVGLGRDRALFLARRQALTRAAAGAGAWARTRAWLDGQQDAWAARNLTSLGVMINLVLVLLAVLAVMAALVVLAVWFDPARPRRR